MNDLLRFKCITVKVFKTHYTYKFRYITLYKIIKKHNINMYTIISLSNIS